MANYIINIEDIPGLADEIQIITNLNNILTYGPIKVNTILAYKGLEAGYITPELDFSYNLNVCKDAKIGNNLDVYNNVNVMNTGFINNLVVYNLQNYQYQLIFNGLINNELTSIYVYIDQYYNIYPAYLKNNAIQYLDPVSETIMTNMDDFEYVRYTQNTQYAIDTFSNTITSIETPIAFTIIEGNGINFVELTMTLYNNPVTVYGIQTDVSSNNLFYYDQKTNTLVTATITDNIITSMKGTPLKIKYDQIDKHIFNDMTLNLSTSNCAFYVNSSSILDGDVIMTKNVYISHNVSIDGTTFINSTLNVSDNVSLMNGLNVSNNTSFVGTLNVTDNVSFLNGLNVSNNTSLVGRLRVDGITDIYGELAGHEDVRCLKDLFVTGVTTFTNSTTASCLILTNPGGRPVLTVNQLRTDYQDIAWFQDNSSNVFTIGNKGNTVIKGRLKIGYETHSATDFDNTEFSTIANSTLDISGLCCMNANLEIAGNIISQSDRRIKANIAPMEDCLQKIKNINGCKYNRFDLNDDLHIGLIAQEVEEVFPELVTETNNVKGINYQGFIAVLLNCIKELNHKLEKLEIKKLEKLEK